MESKGWKGYNHFIVSWLSMIVKGADPIFLGILSHDKDRGRDFWLNIRQEPSQLTDTTSTCMMWTSFLWFRVHIYKLLKTCWVTDYTWSCDYKYNYIKIIIKIQASREQAQLQPLRYLPVISSLTCDYQLQATFPKKRWFQTTSRVTYLPVLQPSSFW